MKRPKYKKSFGAAIKAKEKKRISKEMIWTLFIALIMVSSIIGFMYIGEEESAITYKDKYEFVRRNNGFVYDHEGQEFLFRFLPNEVEDLAGDLSGLKQPSLKLTFDPDSEFIQSIELLRFELSNELPRLNVYLEQGITRESEVYAMPIIDCEDATPGSPVIKFIKTNITAIGGKDSCFLFSARNDYDVAKLKDVLVYVLLGIL